MRLKGRGSRGSWSPLAMAVAALTIVPGSSHAEPSGDIALDGVVENHAVWPMSVDETRRLLYVNDGSDIVEYDLRHPYGDMEVRRKKFAFEGVPLDTAFDPAARTLFVATRESGFNAACSGCSVIVELNLKTLTLGSRRWDIASVIPGLWLQGFDYSARDRRIYLQGKMTGGLAGDLSESGVLNPPLLPVVVAAVDVDAPPGPGAVAWVRMLPTCSIPLGDVYASQRYPMLYVPCVRQDEPFSGTPMLPGRVGVARLTVPSSGNALPELREEFFRASGSFSTSSGITGMSLFDPVSERMFLTSRSFRVPGVWVFDGRLSAWAGFVPTDGSSNLGLGVNPETGHLLIKDSTALRVSNAWATPVPQGEAYDVSAVTSIPNMSTRGGKFLFDPPTKRVFATIVSTVDGRTFFGAFRVTRPLEASEEVCWDCLTDDIAESPETLTTFAGSASGFGARSVVVGGLGGVSSAARSGFVGKQIQQQGGATPGLAPGDRGFWAGHLRLLDLRNVGATGQAQALELDGLSANEHRTVHGQVAGAGPSQQDLQMLPPPLQRPFDALAWPWQPAFCLASEGETSADTAELPAGGSQIGPPSGDAAVACDMEQTTADAQADLGVVRAGVVSVARSSVEGHAVRLPGKVEVQATAAAQGVEVKVDGSGTLRIGDVRMQVTARAGGRTGTSDVTWRRSLEAVELRNAAGEVVVACGANCDPHVVAEHVNDVFGADLRMSVPDPEVIESPKGAFAGFWEGFSGYVNDLVMNNDVSRAVSAIQFELMTDTGEKSRTFVQVAAVEASAIYGITKGPSDACLLIDCDPDPCGSACGNDPDPPAPVVDLDPSPPSLDDTPEPFIPDDTPLSEAIVRTAIFIARSPKDAVSMILIMSMAGWLTLLWHRRASLRRVL